MPNFLAKTIKPLNLPFEKDGVKLEFVAKNEAVNLIMARVENESFFLQIKAFEEGFIIKGDKHSKPSKIGLLQKALSAFEDQFCVGVFSKSYAFKKTALLKEDELIAGDYDELLSKTLAWQEADKENLVFVEIGFGSGRHLLLRAQQNPKALMIGIEIYNPAITQVAKLARSKKLSNVLLIQSDARLLLSVLPSKSVKHIFLHFPVPWDKKPHRRVISAEFCKQCARVLLDSGKFELRTDSFEYFNFALQSFLDFKKAKFSIAKNENLDISSKYEDRWKKQQKDIFDLLVFNLNLNDISQIKSGKELGDDKRDDFNLNELELNADELTKIKQNLALQSFKEDNFFLKIDSIYECENAILIKLAFGAFNRPEHSYLKLDTKLSFLFKEPFKIEENLKAINFFVNFLKFKLK